MNVGQAAHLSGQMSGQATQMNQVGGSGGGGGGVAGADGLPQHQQMQDVVGLGTGIDPQFVMLRDNMREKIFEYIGRKHSSADWRRRQPELARRLEEILFRKFPNKNEYYHMMKQPIEPQLQFAIKTFIAQNQPNQQNQQNQQMTRQVTSSSGYGTMIPTPGITQQGASGNSRMSDVTDNTGLSSSGAGMVPQNANMGTSLPGSMSNGYQHLNTSVPLNSTTSSVQSTMGPVGILRQVTHMIPTPGFNNQQNVPANPSATDRDAQNKEAPQLHVRQLRKMLDLLVHASTCRSGRCQYRKCRKVKGLFCHGMQCKTRASGGCALCKKMWYMLQLHARACRDSECSVPRCRDLKEHLRRLQQQSDSRRRAAVNEMMRQRAAEVAAHD